MTFSLIVLSTEHWNSKRQARKELLYKAVVQSGEIRSLTYIEPMAYWWRKNQRPQRFQEGIVNIFRWRCPLPGERFSPIITLNRFYQALRINQILPEKVNKVVGIFYHPYHWLITRHTQRGITWIFDWTDDWGTYHDSSKISSQQNNLIQQCDGVVTVSNAFFERAKAIRKDNHILHLPNATSLPPYNDLNEPRELKKIKRPRIGFMGHLGPWIDLEIIKAVAGQFHDYQWCILGHGSRSVKKQLTTYRNIHFLGIQNYTSLPKWMAFMDILAAPYIQKNLIGDASKIYDYLTSGKPIISNSNNTAKSFPGLIEIADTITEWEKALKKCIQEKDSHLIQLRKQEAMKHNWMNRANSFIKWLNEISN